MTGAAGLIGRYLRDLLPEAYPKLRLSDIADLGEARPGEELDRTDLRDRAAVDKMVQGVDGIIHLGGIPGKHTWDDISAINIEGTRNVLEAAREHGVKRIVFASSNHAIGFYPRDQRIDHTAAPLPDSRYGVSKAAGEALCAMYAYRHAIGALVIRIGHVNLRPKEDRHLAIWQSPRDLLQLVRIGLDRPGLRHEVVYGVSDNQRSWWDNANAVRLGYRPVDRSEDYASSVTAGAPQSCAADEAIVGKYQGGFYCVLP